MINVMFSFINKIVQDLYINIYIYILREREKERGGK